MYENPSLLLVQRYASVEEEVKRRRPLWLASVLTFGLKGNATNNWRTLSAFLQCLQLVDAKETSIAKKCLQHTFSAETNRCFHLPR